MTTPTPRTDAALKSRNHLPEGWPDVVTADFARQLETELAAANALLREAKDDFIDDYELSDRIAAHLEASK